MKTSAARVVVSRLADLVPAKCSQRAIPRNSEIWRPVAHQILRLIRNGIPNILAGIRMAEIMRPPSSAQAQHGNRCHPQAAGRGRALDRPGRGYHGRFEGSICGLPSIRIRQVDDIPEKHRDQGAIGVCKSNKRIRLLKNPASFCFPRTRRFSVAIGIADAM